MTLFDSTRECRKKVTIQRSPHKSMECSRWTLRQVRSQRSSTAGG